MKVIDKKDLSDIHRRIDVRKNALTVAEMKLSRKQRKLLAAITIASILAFSIPVLFVWVVVL